MVERFDPPRDLDWKPLPMRSDIAGQYVRYSDLATALAEIERLTKERDEARAQVAMAYEAAAETTREHIYYDSAGTGFSEEAFDDAIRALTPADAQAALEAYGREKVREGMRRAARRVSTYLREANLPLRDRSPGAQLGIADAILAEMEREADHG